MSEIKIERNPNEGQLDELGVTGWPIWTKEASQFPWSYDASETCFFLEGDVIVSPDSGKPVAMGKGDLVTFPKGMSCTWEIRKGVRKHYILVIDSRRAGEIRSTRGVVAGLVSRKKLKQVDAQGKGNQIRALSE